MRFLKAFLLRIRAMNTGRLHHSHRNLHPAPAYRATLSVCLESQPYFRLFWALLCSPWREPTFSCGCSTCGLQSRWPYWSRFSFRCSLRGLMTCPCAGRPILSGFSSYLVGRSHRSRRRKIAFTLCRVAGRPWSASLPISWRPPQRIARRCGRYCRWSLCTLYPFESF